MSLSILLGNNNDYEFTNKENVVHKMELMSSLSFLLKFLGCWKYLEINMKNLNLTYVKFMFCMIREFLILGESIKFSQVS